MAIKTTKTNSKENLVGKQKTLSTKLAVSKETIAQTAYYIWEEKGRPANSDLENWIEAEKRLGK